MGMQDRDWYRDAYANKTGRVYDKRTGFYRAKQPKGSGEARATVAASGSRASQQPGAKPWHPVLSVFLVGAICVGVFGLLKLIAKFA